MLDLQEITKKIIGCAIEVHRNLGPGLLEQIYENALCIELETSHIKFKRQVIYPVLNKNKKNGEHRIDLLIDDNIVVEIKSVERFDPIFEAQILTYLKITGKKMVY